MGKTSRHDAWQAGASYDAYMGRWSRQIAPRFLEWLNVAENLDWLEVGCGTGALSVAILAKCQPTSLLCLDSSESFLSVARDSVADPRVQFRLGDAQALDIEDQSRDLVVSALVLNFLPDRIQALSEMRRVTRPGGKVAFYVWDYPGGGLEFLRSFWTAASTLDPSAAELTEDRRFPFCTPDGLRDMVVSAGLRVVDVSAIEIPTRFEDYDDFWHPFSLGAGPAPGYVASLDQRTKEELKERLRERLPSGSDGAITLKARAWALQAAVA